jgi:hypothetical protein
MEIPDRREADYVRRNRSEHVRAARPNMRIWKGARQGSGGFSKTKVLLGAGGLLLFIIGLKRSHRLDAERSIGPSDDEGEAGAVQDEDGGPGQPTANRFRRPVER